MRFFFLAAHHRADFLVEGEEQALDALFLQSGGVDRRGRAGVGAVGQLAHDQGVDAALKAGEILGDSTRHLDLGFHGFGLLFPWHAAVADHAAEDSFPIGFMAGVFEFVAQLGDLLDTVAVRVETQGDIGHVRGACLVRIVVLLAHQGADAGVEAARNPVFLGGFPDGLAVGLELLQAIGDLFVLLVQAPGDRQGVGAHFVVHLVLGVEVPRHGKQRTEQAEAVELVEFDLLGVEDFLLHVGRAVSRGSRHGGLHGENGEQGGPHRKRGQ